MGEPDKTTADRLTLISDMRHLRLDPPVLVRVGERYWFDWDERLLYVEDQDGRCRSFAASWPGGPDPKPERGLREFLGFVWRRDAVYEQIGVLVMATTSRDAAAQLREAYGEEFGVSVWSQEDAAELR